MPSNKKTAHTNKKRNRKIQDAKQKKTPSLCLGWIDDETSSENYNWAKNVNAKIFNYYKNNMIMCKVGSPEFKVFGRKVSNGKLNADDYVGVPIKNDTYICNLNYLKEFQKIANKMVNSTISPMTEEYSNDVKGMLFELILNNPKPIGEINNFNIGFMGSIWIDMVGISGKSYRLAFYNKGLKDYSKMSDDININPWEQ